MNLAYPFQIAPTGRTADISDERHIRDLVEQVLFTAPGERVMRPDFGAGVAGLVFAPNAIELASATQMLVQSSLQLFLGGLITVEAVNIAAEDAVLTVAVRYSIRASEAVRVETFSRAIGGAS